MNIRQKNIETLASTTLDVLIVGGGINGAVSAAALSALGLKVGLIDARDFAGFTSQQSSNLIWGGIKYLETYEFSLVSGLCKARNVLLDSYPTAVEEIRFLTTIPKSFRRHPRLVWAGAWLYWLIGRGRTQKPVFLSRDKLKKKEPVINTSSCRGGIEYSDAILRDNDARFVFNFVRSAMDNGCVASNYLSASSATLDSNGIWKVAVEDTLIGQKYTIRSRAVVNAAGAFVDAFNAANAIETRYKHIFSKGIHLIVPRIGECDRVLAFFADDGRLFFAIPMGNRTCIGTTDTPVSDPITRVTEQDRDFVLDNINARLDLRRPLTRDDIIAERCGVRPLAIEKGANSEVDFLELSRKHVVEQALDKPYMSIFGGKLTDCLNVGDEVCARLLDFGIEAANVNLRNTAWYGEPTAEQRVRYTARAKALSLDTICLPGARENLPERLWRRYGIAASGMLDAIEQDRTLSDGVIEGAALYRCELVHLADKEMITSLEDVLHRRTRIGLVVSRDILINSPGTMELCRVIFGASAETEFKRYFDSSERLPTSKIESENMAS